VTTPHGQPLVADTSGVSPESVTTMLLLSTMELIHLMMVVSTPCLSSACGIAANEVLSVLPLCQVVALRPFSCASLCSQLQHCAVQLQWISWLGKQTGFCAEDWFSAPRPLCLSTNSSIIFSKKGHRPTRRYALDSVQFVFPGLSINANLVYLQALGICPYA